MVLNMSQAQHSNWCVQIKECLDRYGYSEVWLNGGVGNEQAFLRHLKQRMIDCFRQDWHANLYSSDRYEIYRIFKSLIGSQPEKYLTAITIPKFRQCMVKFRLGLCQLNINNRFSDAPNLCYCCNTEIENEYHFLFVCPKYTQLRVKYIFKHCKSTTANSLTTILQSENISVLRDSGMFIFYALRIRENNMAV